MSCTELQATWGTRWTLARGKQMFCSGKQKQLLVGVSDWKRYQGEESVFTSYRRVFSSHLSTHEQMQFSTYACALLAGHCTPSSLSFLVIWWLLTTFKWSGRMMWPCRGSFASRITLCRAPGPEPASNNYPMGRTDTLVLNRAHPVLKVSPCIQS